MNLLSGLEGHQVGTLCTGVCVNGTASEGVINATCMETESGPKYVDDEEKILSHTDIDTWSQAKCLGE